MLFLLSVIKIPFAEIFGSGAMALRIRRCVTRWDIYGSDGVEGVDPSDVFAFFLSRELYIAQLP